MKSKTKKYKCTKCTEEDESKFYFGRKNICKNCILENSKNKYTNMTLQDKKTYSEKQKKWRSENIFQFRLLQAKYRAKEKNIPFNISCDTLEKLWINQNGFCFYSGIKMEKIKTGIYAVSIDRINSNLGYEESNIVLCTNILNSMKNSLNTELFYNIIDKIYKFKNNV